MPPEPDPAVAREALAAIGLQLTDLFQSQPECALTATVPELQEWLRWASQLHLSLQNAQSLLRAVASTGSGGALPTTLHDELFVAETRGRLLGYAHVVPMDDRYLAELLYPLLPSFSAHYNPASHRLTWADNPCNLATIWPTSLSLTSSAPNPEYESITSNINSPLPSLTSLPQPTHITGGKKLQEGIQTTPKPTQSSRKRKGRDQDTSGSPAARKLPVRFSIPEPTPTGSWSVASKATPSAAKKSGIAASKLNPVISSLSHHARRGPPLYHAVPPCTSCKATGKVCIWDGAERHACNPCRSAHGPCSLLRDPNPEQRAVFMDPPEGRDVPANSPPADFPSFYAPVPPAASLLPAHSPPSPSLPPQKPPPHSKPHSPLPPLVSALDYRRARKLLDRLAHPPCEPENEFQAWTLENLTESATLVVKNTEALYNHDIARRAGTRDLPGHSPSAQFEKGSSRLTAHLSKLSGLLKTEMALITDVPFPLPRPQPASQDSVEGSEVEVMSYLEGRETGEEYEG